MPKQNNKDNASNKINSIAKPLSVKDKIINNIDSIIKDLEANKSYKEISLKLGVSMGWLCEVLNSPEYRARKTQALQIASYQLLEEGEQCLNDIDDGATNAKVRRQAELYQHKIYLAKTKNRAELDLNYKEPVSEQIAINVITPDWLNCLKNNNTGKNEILANNLLENAEKK
jgi:hypothetical protein